MGNCENIVFPVKRLVQAAGKRRYTYHAGSACSNCGGPRGTKADGSPRSDRYCANCRKIYNRDHRAKTKQQRAAERLRFRAMAADLSDLKHNLRKRGITP